jgi:tetratricopeptide (TPR) repeat protein
MITTGSKSPPLWIWCLFLLVLWQISLWAQNPGLMSDDGGEMVAAAYTLGLPHPPGYPLFCLLGRLFSFIPVGIVAFRFNLLSAIFVLTSVCMIGLSGFEFLKSIEKRGPQSRILIPVVGLPLLCLFSCRGVFDQALTSKGCVYTLTLLFLAIFWFLRLRTLDKGIPQSLFLFIVFLWSVGMTNHWESEILWLPFLLYWFWQEKFEWTIKGSLRSMSVLLIGLSLYLYLPLRASNKPRFCWGDPTTIKEFWWVISREAFRGFEPITRSLDFYRSFLNEYGYVSFFYWMPGLFLLAMVGLYYLGRHRREILYSGLAFYLPVVFAILLVPRAETKFLLSVYLLSTQGLVAFWAICGLYWICQKLGSRYVYFLGCLSFVVGGWMFWCFYHEDMSRYTLAGDLSLNVVKMIPRNSVFLSESDNYVMPFVYEREVEGKRNDLIFETSVFLFHDWGWKQLASQDPAIASAVMSKKDLQSRLNALTTLGVTHGIYYDTNKADLGKFLDRTPGEWLPWALVEKWSPKAMDNLTIFKKTIDLSRTERLREMDSWEDPDDVTTFEIRHYYANQFFSTGQWLRQRNDIEMALVLFEKGLVFYPNAAFAYSEMGAMAGELGYLRLAKRLLLKSVQGAECTFSSYVNLSHVYWLEGDGDKALSCYESGLERFFSNKDYVREQLEIYRRGLNAPRIKMVEKGDLEYKRLADRFEKNDASFLALQTREAIQERVR